MKKKISLLVVLMAVGISLIYFIKNDLVNGITYSDAVETMDSSTNQINLKPNDINSRTILLKNLDTEEILLKKNTKQKVAIASLTKLMTVYVLLESTKNLDETVMIKQSTMDNLIKEGASLSGYLAGDTLTVRDLAYGIVLPSGGDASITAANFVSGSEKSFVSLMNKTAEKLGMKETHFQNATGLDARNNYSTTEDLLKLMNTALKNKDFYQLLVTTKYQTEEKNYAPEGYYIESTILKDSADLSLSNGKLLGGKTGYTEKAGQCLISLAEVSGNRYLLITTGADGNPNTVQKHVSDARYIYQSIEQS